MMPTPLITAATMYASAVLSMPFPIWLVISPRCLFPACELGIQHRSQLEQCLIRLLPADVGSKHKGHIALWIHPDVRQVHVIRPAMKEQRLGRPVDGQLAPAESVPSM